MRVILDAIFLSVRQLSNQSISFFDESKMRLARRLGVAGQHNRGIVK